MSETTEVTVCCRCETPQLPVSEATTVEGKDYCNDCLYDNTFECEKCNERFEDENSNSVNDKTICDKCYTDLVVTCNHCDTSVFEENTHSDEDGNDYCSACGEEYLISCGKCECAYDRDDMTYTEDHNYVCSDCSTRHFSACSDCSDVFLTNNMSQRNSGIYCEGCEGDHMDGNSDGVSEYSYKPDPIFYGHDNNLFMGVEVEMDCGGNSNYSARQLMGIMNEYGHSHIYIKEDGSISEGFEVVSHPATLDYHMNSMKWEKMFDKAVVLDYRSHSTQSCGLHVHISRDFFGDGESEQDVGIMKLLYLVERFWDEVLKFSRRSEAKAKQWANRYGLYNSEQNDPSQLLDRAKADTARYRAVNLLNEHTIEIRIFRGSLRYETLIATLQFCHLLSTLSNTLELQEVVNLHWSDFVEKASIHDELTAYLKLRGLAIAEDTAVDDVLEV
jgi:hypothetical protein